MADFYVLFHNHPGNRLCQRRRGQRAVVRPVVICVGGQQAARVEPVKLYYTVLQKTKETNIQLKLVDFAWVTLQTDP